VIERVLEVSDLTVRFQPPTGPAYALVRDASFSIGAGEVVCLVGESGSGKSVTSQAIMRLIQEQRGITADGSVRFMGQDVLSASDRRIRDIRGRDMAIVFQEPMNSLDPVYPIENQLVEAIRRTGRVPAKIARQRATDLLAKVGINGIDRTLRSYPHQLSGGMCQRVMIAMAVACNPRLLIADEPTTALDVTIQAQILELLAELRQEFGMAMLLVTHDMGVAAQVADRIVVMYAGRVVEQSTTADLFRRPMHPYTAGLLDCIPRIGGTRAETLPAIAGNVPEPRSMPPGCAFHPRCPAATERCATEDPPLAEVAGRPVACWHPAELTAGRPRLEESRRP
jgi:oligopeptide/dipeptide ABC transporter ATP-binding protein